MDNAHITVDAKRNSIIWVDLRLSKIAFMIERWQTYTFISFVRCQYKRIIGSFHEFPDHQSILLLKDFSWRKSYFFPPVLS